MQSRCVICDFCADHWRLYMWSLVCFFFVLTFPILASDDYLTGDTIQRLNFGAVFQPLSTVDIIQDAWYHSFYVELPRKPTPHTIRVLVTELTNALYDDLPYLYNTRTASYEYSHLDFCSVNSSCDMARALTRHAIVYRYQNTYQLKEIMDGFFTQIPTFHRTRLQRESKKTAWDGFLTFLAIANHNDMQKINENVKSLYTALHAGLAQMSQLADSFSSYSRSVNLRA